VLVLGVTYKRDIEDVRESPALDIPADPGEPRARVGYNDPNVAGPRPCRVDLRSVDSPAGCASGHRGDP